MARVAAKDIRTTTARNLQMVRRETGGLEWSAPLRRIKEELKAREPAVPDVETWRLPYLGKLLEDRDVLVYHGEEGSKQVEKVQGLIDSLCSS